MLSAEGAAVLRGKGVGRVECPELNHCSVQQQQLINDTLYSVCEGKLDGGRER